MPSLSKADRERLLGPTGAVCPHCDGTRIRHYCRSCDVFFLTCDCVGRLVAEAHQGHRLYIWGPNGIAALPDFDPPEEETRAMPVAARCAWEVTAGLIPGQVMPEHTRRFGLTSSEWEDGKGYELFVLRAAQAEAYARFLQELCAHGREVNWTRLDFVWF